MHRSRIPAALLSLILIAVPAWSHDETVTGSSANSRKLAFVIPNLFGAGGLTLPNATHNAHFVSAFQASFVPFNRALASQLTSLPIPSPASGFIYSFDSSLGVYTRSVQSFGPVLAERAETIGKDKFYFGFTYQSFRFDSIDGVNLNSVPVVFTHVANPAAPEFAKDVIVTDNFININIGQVATFFTFGLAERLDLSVAVPFVSADLTAQSKAQIRRIGTAGDPSIHNFGTAGDGTRADFSGAGTARGIGDVIVRLKGTALRSARTGLAFGLDLRAPTGDEYNFLGSGALGVRPFAALSFRAGKVSPHLNAGYQWNGQTVLAGDVVTGRKERLPNQLQYVAGADIGVNSKLTVAFDVLGQNIRNTDRVFVKQFTAADSSVHDQIDFRKGAINEVNGAAGVKINPVGNLIVSFNLLFKLNDAGLRGRIAPLFGLSYTFGEAPSTPR